jgi:hypothetical protein
MAKTIRTTGEVSPPDQTRSPESRDYKIGYGRPPLGTRFKPGQSGNAKGRPKGAKNLATLTREKLEAKVTVREGGREKRMSKAEIGVTKLVNRFAETGDPKLFQALARLQEAGSAPTGPGTIDQTPDENTTNQAMLQWFLSRHGAEENQP